MDGDFDGEVSNAIVKKNEKKINVNIQYDLEPCQIDSELNIVEKIPPSPVDKEDDANKIMLEPDHPLLAKFQQALKEQLERQLEKLNNEVHQIENEIKKKENDRTALGERLYDAQQLITMQRVSLDKVETEIQKVCTERNEIEVELKSIHEKYNGYRDKVTEVNKKEHELQTEMETMNFLLSKMNEWQDKLQSELAVNQRIKEKSKSDKKLYMEEMRNLDIIIYKLMTEVFRLENSLDNLDMQLRVKEQEREAMGTKIADANADIEALEEEHKRLMHSWNSVLVAIGHRDKIYLAAKKNLEKEQEVLQETLIEIRGFKRLSEQQMEKNEQLTLVKGRIEMDKGNLSSRLQSEQDKITNLERKLIENQSLITQVSADLDRVLMEKRAKEQEIADIQQKITKSNIAKAELDDKLLSMLQEQLSSDKVSKYMNKTIRDLREKNRNFEIQLAINENKNADILVAIEQQKELNEETVHRLNEILKQEKIHLKELNDKKTELNSIIFEIGANQSKYDAVSKNYDELLAENGGIELTPLELKIKTLEKRIAELDDKNNKLKALWLREQLYIVSLKKERTTQTYEMNLMKKQSMLMQQKNMKMEDELEELEYQERKHARTMNNMKTKIDKLNHDLWKKRGVKENIDLTNLTYKMENISKLKDAELECIKLEAKILDMEEAKEELSNEIIEANRDMLAWERKVKLAAETKISICKEMGADGEISNMRSEIHRMEVRLGQLKKAQEKLILDLNYCLARRDVIFDSATANEKRATTNTINSNRLTFLKRIENEKVKLKKTENNRIEIEQKIEEINNLEAQYYKQIEENDKKIEELKQTILDLINNIEKAKFQRQKELEILVYKQHKLHAFTAITKNQYRRKYKSKIALDREYEKEQRTNGKLKSVVENLIITFPQHQNVFVKTLNTLNVCEPQ